MRVFSKLVILGTETISSKKVAGKYYNQVNFVDGSNPCNILCDDIGVFNSLNQIPSLTPVECELDIRLGRYTSCNLITCKPLK